LSAERIRPGDKEGAIAGTIAAPRAVVDITRAAIEELYTDDCVLYVPPGIFIGRDALDIAALYVFLDSIPS
jgi:hypothetical protein